MVERLDLPLVLDLPLAVYPQLLEFTHLTQI